MSHLVQLAPAPAEIIRVFPRRTKWTPDDPLSFIGPPPLFRPGNYETPICYTMIGYDHETAGEAESRIERVYELGFWPFCQLYQPPTAPMPTKIYSDEWKRIAKKWSRPAAYNSQPTPPVNEFADAQQEI